MCIPSSKYKSEIVQVLLLIDVTCVGTKFHRMKSIIFVLLCLFKLQQTAKPFAAQYTTSLTYVYSYTTLSCEPLSVY